ncbi:MAG: putative endonuclease [Thermomicrobiales bacterium]|nr:putative endonuclease [Thermomicrobiales bacterium]
MVKRLRAGVVGCGGVAQMMQFPYLRELNDRFELAALCDVDIVNAHVWERRVWQQKDKIHDGFTKRYNITLLVYAETFAHPSSAIEREKQLKNWSRAKKIALIESLNPYWLDLSADWFK